LRRRNFVFGHHRGGNVELLKRLGAELVCCSGDAAGNFQETGQQHTRP
jgi:hypothetical protein